MSPLLAFVIGLAIGFICGVVAVVFIGRAADNETPKGDA